MGATYGNITLRGPTPAQVQAVLAGRKGLITPHDNQCVVLFMPAFDEQKTEAVAKIAVTLSKTLSCAAWAVCVFDDDVLWYQLYLNGMLIDEYDSSPGYFDPHASPSSPKGGDAGALASAFGATNEQEIEDILRVSITDSERFVFQTERHEALVSKLGSSDWAVGLGYKSFENGELPSGLNADDILWLRPAKQPRSKNTTSKTAVGEQLVRGFIAQNRLATALGEAARWGHLPLVRELVEKLGVAVNSRNEFGDPPIAMAASGGQIPVIKWLIEHGADVNAISPRYGTTPLMACVAAWHHKSVYLQVAKLLIEAGATKTLDLKETSDGKTALDYAKDGRPAELVTYLESQLPRTDT